ncbi:hypothetical protein Aperf_G00000016364 [Anoplocephala perfoliata]
MWTQGIATNTTASIHCDTNQLTQNLRSPSTNDNFSSEFQEGRRSGSARHEQIQLYDHDRDLIELRGRCAQLEKTVRWWSDCTNNWREKWSCVRDERNQLRDELRRTKLALNSLQRQNEELLHRLDEIAIAENKDKQQSLDLLRENPNPSEQPEERFVKSNIELLERENSELKEKLVLLTQRLARSDKHPHRIARRSSGASSCSPSRSPSTSVSGSSASHSGSSAAVSGSASSRTSRVPSPTPPRHMIRSLYIRSHVFIFRRKMINTKTEALQSYGRTSKQIITLPFSAFESSLNDHRVTLKQQKGYPNSPIIQGSFILSSPEKLNRTNKLSEKQPRPAPQAKS